MNTAANLKDTESNLLDVTPLWTDSMYNDLWKFPRLYLCLLTENFKSIQVFFITEPFFVLIIICRL